MRCWVLVSTCLLVLAASSIVSAKRSWTKTTKQPIPKNGTENSVTKKATENPALKKGPEHPPKAKEWHPVINMFAHTFDNLLESSPEGRKLLKITQMATEVATVFQHFVLKTLQFVGSKDPEITAQNIEKEIAAVLTTVGSEEFALGMGSATAHLLFKTGLLTEENAVKKAQSLADDILGVAKMLNIQTLQGKVGSLVFGVQKFLWRNGLMAVEYSEDLVTYFSKYLQSFSGKKTTKALKPTTKAVKHTTKALKPTTKAPKPTTAAFKSATQTNKPTWSTVNH